MTSGPHIHILTASTTLIGDPPLRTLRVTQTPTTLWANEGDGDGLPRRRSRLVGLPASALRCGGTSRVAFLITAGDDAIPHRIEVDSHTVTMTAIESENRPDMSIPRPRPTLDGRPAGGERRQ